MRRSYRSVLDNPSGAPLNRAREWLEVVVPEATTNLFLNPSWETNTSNWTATSDGSTGTPYARTTAAQHKGAYSAILTVRPTAGTFVQIVGSAVTSSQDYTISFHVRRPNGGVVRAADVRAVVNGAATTFDRIFYVADGWYRCEKSYRASSTSAPGIRVQGSPGAIFYVDSAQLENKLYPTTYCDGDQIGLLAVERVTPFRWNGTPHASTSSRTAFTRAGGRLVSVAKYGLTILGLIGMGFAPRSVISTPLGLLDGGLYQRTIREARGFTVAGAFEAQDARYLSAQRGALRALLSHDNTGDDQPLMLYLQRYDDTEALGDRVCIAASYMDGLGEDLIQVYSEQVSIQFQEWAPLLLRDADRGAALDTGDSTASINYIVERRADGSWATLGSGLNAVPQRNALAFGPDGKIYVGGNFTTPGTRIARYNFETAAWETLSTGLTQQVNALAFAPDGTLLAGLNVAVTIGPRTGSVVYWDGSAWAVYGTGNSDSVRALIVTPAGGLFAAGTTGGNATVRSNGLTSGPTTAWTAITAATAGVVYDLEYANNTLYIGGDFTNLAGVATADNIARYVNAIAGVGSAGADGIVYSLASDALGTLYAAGAFTLIGGITGTGFATFNGTAWQPIAGIVNTLVSGDGAFAYDRLRLLLIASETVQPFSVSGITIATNGNGSVDMLSNITLVLNLPRAYAATSERQVFAVNSTGAQSVGGRATISNPSTAPVPYQLRITNGSTTDARRLYQLENNTNGGQVTFDLLLFAGESVVIAIDAVRPRVVSDRRGDITATSIVGAVDWGRLLLLKGANTITAFAESPTDVTGVLWLTPQYESFDDATRAP